MPPIYIAVLGTGMSARVFHVPFIRALPQHFTLHTVVSSDPARAAASFPGAGRYTSDRQSVTEDADIKVVAVCLPNSEHYAVTKMFLEAGKHVILEKPLCETSAKCDELIALAKSKGLCIAAFQNRRFDSDFKTLAKVIESGELGSLSELETRYDRFRPALKGGTWKELGGVGQGVLYDLGSHLIDQVLTLFGHPARIWASVINARKLGPEDYHDSFIAHFFYDADDKREIPLRVTLTGGVLSLIEPQQRYVVKGTKGSFVKYGLDVQEAQLIGANPLPLDAPEFGVENPNIHGVLTTEAGKRVIVSEKGNYLDWYRGVAAALEANDPSLLPVKPEQARDVIRAIEIAYESSDSGKVLKWTGTAA
ncbi:putative NAD binding Rossmann fold oxidoreductase [Auriculariales sp. MPI-PUGE-AT-0066]|nr:putative NAD binding Rossmann fold oxidoreductase [Auriculariales sp. MPI-PUGE-AT-0066]